MQTINERITELMNGDYDPLRADNLAETLANLTTIQAETIADFLLNHRYELTGLYIDTIAVYHWKRLARIQAEADEENEHLAACQRCHGEGCSSCNDLDDDRRTDNEN